MSPRAGQMPLKSFVLHQDPATPCLSSRLVSKMHNPNPWDLGGRVVDTVFLLHAHGYFNKENLSPLSGIMCPRMLLRIDGI